MSPTESHLPVRLRYSTCVQMIDLDTLLKVSLEQHVGAGVASSM